MQSNLCFEVNSMKNPDRKCNIAYMYCAFCNSEHSKVQNNLYLLYVSQSGEFKSAKQLMFTVIFTIRSTRKCKITYIYCVFCNQENPITRNLAMDILVFFNQLLELIVNILGWAPPWSIVFCLILPVNILGNA